MNVLANPWMLLGALVSLLAVGTVGYNLGARATRGDDLARVNAAQNAAAAYAQQWIETENRRALAAAAAEARTATRVRVVKQEVIRYVTNRAECALPAADLDRLRNLVAAANADQPADPAGVPDALPANPATH